MKIERFVSIAKPGWLLVSAALLLGSHAAAAQALKPAVSCESLARLTLPDTTITLAEPVAQSAFKEPKGGESRPGAAAGQAVQSQSMIFSDHGDLTQPAFCRVAATLKPSADSNIHIEVWLPTENYNGKLFGIGGGGWGGKIDYNSLNAGIRRGYVSVTTDTGHSPADGSGASFAVGHPEKLIDYGYRAVHLMTVRGKELAKAFYGAPVKRAYFAGYSLGGYQAVMEANRFPEDYDAISAGAPPNPLVLFNAEQLWANLLIAENPARLIPEKKYVVVHEAAMKACAGVVGNKEGYIEDPIHCDFDPGVLLCKGGDQPDCLTAPQVELMRKTYQGPVDSRTGKVWFPGVAKGSELELFPFANGEPRQVPLDMYKKVVFQNPNWDWKTMNFSTDIDKAIAATSPMLIAFPKFKDFAQRGGKIMMYLGFHDYHNPAQLIGFYEDAARDMGPELAKKSMRVFAVPGLVQGHCDSCGEFASWDKVGILDEWVEKGIVPDAIHAAYWKDGKVFRTRDLCAYPAVATYKGSGDTDKAESFSCVVPKAKPAAAKPAPKPAAKN